MRPADLSIHEELQEHVNRSPHKLPELATAHQMPYCILDPRSSALRTLGLYLPAEYRCYDPGFASKRQEFEEQALSLSTSIELYEDFPQKQWTVVDST